MKNFLVCIRQTTGIDFIKKLNDEYNKLRQNFSEKVSYDKIVKNFEKSFADMPQEFKDKFGELQNIIFQSKLGTAEGEKLVKEIIEASGKLKPDEIARLRRNVQQYIDQLEAEFNVEVKIKDDERLKAQVQKMFDDYNLTIELDKLGVDADEVGNLFNIDTKDLLTLEKKLESMKEEFVGRNMEKEYRQFMRKIVEINDKANLEMAKKYVKYLREEYNERAKIELEYMKQRAEVYALPFAEEETSRILDNLQKETQKKLDEIDWKTFQGSDTYIELFEDLGRVSNQALTTMLEKMRELKGSLSNLSPTELKAITDQMQKLQDELLNRNPFKALAQSIREFRDFKADESVQSAIKSFIGDPDMEIKNFRKALDQAITIAQQKVDEAQKNVNLYQTLFGAAESRDKNRELAFEKIEGVNWENVYNPDELKKVLSEIEKEQSEYRKVVNADRLVGITSTEGLSDAEKRYLELDQQAKILSDLISNLETLGAGHATDLIADVSANWESAKEWLTLYRNELEKLKKGKKLLTDQQKAVIKLAQDISDAAAKWKGAFDSIMENLDYLGGATDGLTEAWKEFGDTVFDTITGALGMIPTLVAGFTTAGLEINAAMGIIGLIAEAIQLVITLISALAKVHDAKIEQKIQNLQKKVDKLKKTIDELTEAFDNIYDEDRLRQFDAAIIKTRELYIANLKAMVAAEQQKKKIDQEQIDSWLDEIDDAEKDSQDGIDKFYEALGGFGSAANMKSTVEEWTDAWYDAFKETGDGLSALEDSFEEFFENIVKKTLMQNIMSKYFEEGFLSQLDEILGTEGGVMGNLDALNDWITKYHNLAVLADEEMQQAVQAISNITGIGAGNLEGLQASLQGMTEDTAQALEGYINSVRMYVADSNQILHNLYNVMSIDNETNPMLQQLKIIAAQTTAIHNVFDSVVSFGGDVSGNFVKVKISQ